MNDRAMTNLWVFTLVLGGLETHAAGTRTGHREAAQTQRSLTQ
jgi:hypothetical protein